MTEDDKKKAVVEAADTEELSPEDAMKGLQQMALATLLQDAMFELNVALQQGRPLVITYKVPCPCGKCNTQLSISISPYTAVVYDATARGKH